MTSPHPYIFKETIWTNHWLSVVLIAFTLTWNLCAAKALAPATFNYYGDHQPNHRSLWKDQAIERLSQVFGVPAASSAGQQATTTGRDPPQYMLDLYNSVADHNGITRSANPYNATIIRSFANKGSFHSDVLFFNVSGVDKDEEILSAELHLYRHRQKGKTSFKGSPMKPVIFLVQIYQVTDLGWISHPEKNRLLVTSYVDVAVAGWEIFHIQRTVISDWISGQSPNLGLIVVVTSLQGHPAENHHFFSHDVHRPKQPILVLFSTSKAADAAADAEVVNGTRSTATAPISQYDYTSNFLERKRRSIAVVNNGVESDRSSLAGNRERKNADSSSCQLANMYVDFEHIGWSSWIIFPKGYDAHYCRGQCSFPLGQNQRPTNHATVQSIVSQLHLVEGVRQPCCVPNRLLSLTLLYYDDHDNVILKQYDDMVAESCGCH